MNYYDDYAWVPAADIKKVVENNSRLKVLFSQAQNETAAMRKAYEEIADKQNKLEAENDRLRAEIKDRDAVLAFLWDKVIRTK